MWGVFVTLQVTDSAGGPGFKGLVTMTGLQSLRMKQQQQALTFSCPDYTSGARKLLQSWNKDSGQEWGELKLLVIPDLDSLKKIRLMGIGDLVL